MASSATARWSWVAVHLVLGLAWIALIVGLNPTTPATQALLVRMLVVAGWLPTLPLAILQSNRRGLKRLLATDGLWAGLMAVVVLLLYTSLFFTLSVWFLPLLLLPRGFTTELIFRIARALKVRWRALSAH